MTDVHGYCDPRFQSVRELLGQHLASGNELGASLCVSLDGATVIDLWGGYTTEARSTPWTEDTIVPVWSCSKCVTNLAALILVDRGVLDPYARVSQYWPEFAANGKENTEVRHILSHASGLPAWDMPCTAEEIYDVPLATERLAAQKPWWPPGTASGYHAVSQGHLVGELVRRTSGKPLGLFIRDELTNPLNADFRLGAEEKDWPRCAEIVGPPPPDGPIDMNSLPVRIVLGSALNANNANTPGFRQTEMGGANGVSNARALNRILSVIAQNGTVNGRRILSPETVDLIFREQASGDDLFFRSYMQFGFGYALSASLTADWIPAGKVCFWGGWGGSMTIMDLDRKVTITYVMNRMDRATIGSDRSRAYVREIYAVLDRIST